MTAQPKVRYRIPPARTSKVLHPKKEEMYERGQKPLNLSKKGDPTDFEIDKSLRTGKPMDRYSSLPLEKPEGTPEKVKEFYETVIDENGEEDIPDLPEGEKDLSGELKQIELRYPQISQEFRLKVINKMILRGMTADRIAGVLGVSVRTVYRDRRLLRRRLREEASKFDTNLFLGRNFALYGEIIETAMKMAANEGLPGSDRRDSMRVAMQAQMDANRVAALWRIPEVKPYEGSQEKGGPNTEAGNNLIEMFRAVMSGSQKVDEFITTQQGDDDEDDEDEPRIIS